jgi:hypothetical protein
LAAAVPNIRRLIGVLYLESAGDRWEDAIPTGSGPLGALVFGHVAQDWVVLNHHRCWIEKPRGELPHLAPHLAEIRRLQVQGRWAEAAAVFPSVLKGVNYRCETADYHPLGEIWIHHHDIAVTRDYRSTLDMKTGEVTVAWTMNERRFARRLFVSRVDDAVVLTVNGWEPGTLHMACRLRPHAVEEVTDYGSGRRPHRDLPPITWEAREGDGWHAHIGRYEDGREFGAVLRSVPVGGGESYSDTYWGGAWTGVKGAQSLSCLSSAGTTNPRTRDPRLLGRWHPFPQITRHFLGDIRRFTRRSSTRSLLTWVRTRPIAASRTTSWCRKPSKGTSAMRLSSGWSPASGTC